LETETDVKTKEDLKSFKPAKKFFVGIDSDGCAFDTMEIKHKECFIPNIINSWELQAVSRMAREAAEFVNLYSQWRGINRFPALVMVFDLLADRPEAVERGYKKLQVAPLRQWIAEETALGNPTLTKKVEATGDKVLTQALSWSKAVNADVGKIVRGVPPFPHVRESLQKLQGVSDIICVSATPSEALEREWQEHDIARYARAILGQEQGSKKEHLQFCAGGKYSPDTVLMIGDAPGDMKAARANGFLFYPIMPGDEANSWKLFHDEAADRFLAGTYKGAYEDKLVKQFQAILPETPPWKQGKK
jgi:phosphoglycolate phosphatase-like HAD superfamily hydrolase